MNALVCFVVVIARRPCVTVSGRRQRHAGGGSGPTLACLQVVWPGGGVLAHWPMIQSQGVDQCIGQGPPRSESWVCALFPQAVFRLDNAAVAAVPTGSDRLFLPATLLEQAPPLVDRQEKTGPPSRHLVCRKKARPLGRFWELSARHSCNPSCPSEPTQLIFIIEEEPGLPGQDQACKPQILPACRRCGAGASVPHTPSAGLACKQSAAPVGPELIPTCADMHSGPIARFPPPPRAVPPEAVWRVKARRCVAPERTDAVHALGPPAGLWAYASPGGWHSLVATGLSPWHQIIAACQP
jgi:hypothetical protein